MEEVYFGIRKLGSDFVAGVGMYLYFEDRMWDIDAVRLVVKDCVDEGGIDRMGLLVRDCEGIGDAVGIDRVGLVVRDCEGIGDAVGIDRVSGVVRDCEGFGNAVSIDCLRMAVGREKDYDGFGSAGRSFGILTVARYEESILISWDFLHHHGLSSCFYRRSLGT